MAAPAKFSLALGAKKKGPPLKAKPTAGAKRGRGTFDDSDNEDESVTETRTITSFAGGRAIDDNTPKAVKEVRVIAPPPGTEDGGWLERAMRKRQKGPLPSKQQTTDDTNETINGSSIAYGMTIAEKKEEAHTNGDEALLAEAASVGPEPSLPKKSDDELALQALIEGKADSDRVIPTVINEKEAFQQAYQDAPDMASIEAYQATPIEGFGAALLRGMGWKDGQSIGRRRDGPDVQPRVLERRPALLGIGAKPEDATGGELGAWGKADKTRGRNQQAYIPVLLRNKRTGEQLTEEELKAKQDREKLLENEKGQRKRKSRSPEPRGTPREQKRIEANPEPLDRRDRDRDRDRERNRPDANDRQKDKDRENYREKDRDRDRDRDSRPSRRPRSTSSTRHRKRRHDDDDSHDSHRRKERRRDDDYDSARDRDRKRRDDDYYDSGRDGRRRDDDAYDCHHRNGDRRRRDDHHHRERDRRR